MIRYVFITFILPIQIFTYVSSLAQGFTVKITPFSSETNDEFSPVYYKNGIVYCSNQSENTLIKYNDDQNALFKIYYVAKKDSLGWRKPKILAKELTTDFNDGPATFNKDEDIIYYSRNNSIENSMKNISDPSNKIGIYSAELTNGKWIEITAFDYNNLSYSFGTPALKPDGKRIYFSSDMPGGLGGMDLYYCDKKYNEWGKPINMGPLINTPENESFPFANKSDKLFFASDGRNGLGGKDIYYTREINGKWITPVHLDSTINSTADEFGIVCDSIFENGYFSSNRLNSVDIFSFNTQIIKCFNSDSIKENNYCFTLFDEQNLFHDSIAVTYNWDFGDGIIRIGKEVKHCFPGPGDYSVKLTIIDDLSGKILSNKVEHKVQLKDAEQVCINSYNIGIVGKPITFDSYKSKPESSGPNAYLWNFGDGFKQGKASEERTFIKKGKYLVQLGIVAKAESYGIIDSCVYKKIRIFDSYQELKFISEKEGKKESNSKEEQLKKVNIRIYLMDELTETQKGTLNKFVKEPVPLSLKFNKYGISPSSISFLEKLANLLIQNQDIRLEIIVRTNKAEPFNNKFEISKIWANELSFYFKNKNINIDSYCAKGFGYSIPLFEPGTSETKSTDGVIELIFMNKK